MKLFNIMFQVNIKIIKAIMKLQNIFKIELKKIFLTKFYKKINLKSITFFQAILQNVHYNFIKKQF